MSVTISADCWKIEGISPTQKLVLISLADQANDDGVCWPSVRHMIMRTCLSERAVQAAIMALVEVGLVSRHDRPGRSTYYTLTPAAGAPRTKCTPAPNAPQPPQDVHPTPAAGAPRTVIEPPGESSGTSAAVKIPYHQVVDAYNATCGDLFPQVSRLTDKRRKAIRARWQADTTNDDERKRTDSLDYWQRYFTYCRSGITFFAMAAAGESRGDHACWRPDFDFLMTERAWLGVREGKYQ